MNSPLTVAATDALRAVSLEDKYTLEKGRVYISGTQALARLPMLQKERDRLAGLNTAGYISGYRGSPLGGLDMALWKAKKHLASHDVVFMPGLNEDLAATAVWGTQQVNLYENAQVDGRVSACGTARARAWIARPTCSSTRTPPVPLSTVAY
jgi:indolepyruvate ferredoxin oxidoreductase